MQWTSAANAGFSTAPRAKVCAPVIARGAYGYRRVNAADQRRDPASLLSWFRRAVQVRKESPEIGNGSWEPIATGTQSVFALRFDGSGGTITVLHNLSDQPARARVNGRDLVDVFSDREYDPPGKTVELDAYGFRWLRPPDTL
jgi:maltose alpha-D-glucosyltransferase/alpha-amylase